MGTATLAFVGDLFLSGSYHAVPEAAQRRLFDGLAPALAGSDLAVGNFEGVVMAAEPEGLAPDKIRMSVPPGYLPGLREAGLGVLSLSNNHVFDYGADAFEASRAALVAAGFTPFGAGRTDDEARALVVREVGTLRVGFLGVTCASTHPASPGLGQRGLVLRQQPDLLDEVARARAACDVLVVSIHWGVEHVGWPSPEQLSFGRALVDAGATVVAGHHAHVFQGAERYRDGVIAYGLGGVTIGALRQRVVWHGVPHDYRFDPQPRHRLGALLGVTLRDGRVDGVRLAPVTVDADGRPHAAALAPTPWRWRAMRAAWHLPGYALFFRAVLFTQFKFVPRLRWLLDGSAWRRVTRGRVPAAQPEKLE